MQKGPSQVSSGNIAPAVMGPQKDKDILVLSTLVLVLAGLTGAAWYLSQSEEQPGLSPESDRIDTPNVSEILKKAGTLSQAEASVSTSPPMTASPAGLSDIIHADLHFEAGQKGLTDEGKTQLVAQADLLNRHRDYGVLIQGYTDQQGSASYNKKLGFHRAETVKAALLKAGVVEHRMKVMSLGEEGVLCIDNSDICRRMNRRVHLEIRKIGQEHMATPTVAGATATESSEANAESPANIGQTTPPFSH